MNEYKRGEETVLVKVKKNWLLTIYEPVRESLDLEIGDRVRVTIRIEEGKNKGKEETFLTKVTVGYRICIYKMVRESLDLEVGDRVRITLRKNEIGS